MAQFDESALIAIDCETEGASIYYTLDGATPSASNGTLYSEEFTIYKNATVRTIGVKDGLLDSEIGSEAVTVKLPNKEGYYVKNIYSDYAEIFFPAYLSATYGSTCKCRYTLDGTEPTVSTPAVLAEGGRLTITGNCIFKAIITADDNVNSDIVTISFEALKAETPVIVAFNDEVVADPILSVEY